MPATYTLISSNVLTSSAANVTFSSIPSTYTDLVLRISARTDNASEIGTLYYRFNNDSSAIYSSTQLRGEGATATSGRTSAATSIQGLYADGANATANTFSNVEIYIPNYLSTTNKPSSGYGAQETNAATAYIRALAGLAAVTSAITRIDIITTATNFVSGSSFFLYGISNA